MCGVSAELIDFDQLSDEQTRNLQKNYEGKKKALQAQLEYIINHSRASPGDSR